MSAARNCWWTLLTDPEIRQIEKEFNPAGLTFGPPISWPEDVLTRNLKIAYNRQELRGVAAPSPLPNIQLATEHLTKELNRILNRRIEEQKTPQLAAWIRQGYYTYTHEEVWNPVAVVANSDSVGKPPPDAVVGTATRTTTTSSSSSSSVHLVAGTPSFSRPAPPPPLSLSLSLSLPPVRRESLFRGSDGSTLQFHSRSGGSTTTTTTTGTGIRPSLPPPITAATSPTTAESESGNSPKRGPRGRITRTHHRPGLEPAGSCAQKRSRTSHPCPHCSKTFPFPSKLK